MKTLKPFYLIILPAFALVTFILSMIPVQEEKAEKPNIVWITSEDNSKHYLKLFDDNGIATPHIESLADHGLVYQRAFSNAPVCSAARSALISGSYGPRIGAQYHRKLKKVPMPGSLKMFPAYLREAGYYTTNNSKEDYNIIKGDDVWNESSNKATWKNRANGQPFFHVFNIGVTHESRLHFTKREMDEYYPKTDEQDMVVQPNHPNTKIFRYTNAFYRDKIREMDAKVGNVVKELEEEGLLDETFIFYFGDHGGVLPGSKGYLYETGLHVPLVIHIPEKFRHLAANMENGGTVDGFVSFIDFGPTVLNLAGIKIPEGFDGKPFLGKDMNIEEVNSRDETYSYADRMDERHDQVRAIRKGKFKYIRNYQPFNFDGLLNNYRYKQLAYQEWETMHEEGKLNEIQAAFFNEREPEMLYDVLTDPFETKNLIHDPEYQQVAKDLRLRLNNWVMEMPDLSFFPEHVLLEQAIDNPTAFGKTHKEDIQKYIEIANLSLLDFEEVNQSLRSSLEAEDPWERYWALITCSNFKMDAESLIPKITAIAESDTEPLNRVRAAEYLGITHTKNPAPVMTEALYDAKNPAEALLILNSMTLMRSNLHNYSFDIQAKKLAATVARNNNVQLRLNYLNNR